MDLVIKDIEWRDHRHDQKIGLLRCRTKPGGRGAKTAVRDCSVVRPTSMVQQRRAYRDGHRFDGE